MTVSRFLAAATPLALLCACSGNAGESPAAAASESADPVPGPAPAAGEATAAPSQAAGPPAAFFQCASCHSVEPGRNGIGPTLFGIVGSKAGEVPGYAFSEPLARSGIVWDRATLDQWLQGPMKMVPGTKMVISVPNPEARKAVIDYLETLK
ncbi:c-type cytochrome [Novosphingobium album (ex Liu et al. 2023)]|uniref:C-type cytochrome n=1 Tax=Novosphingobium album (ex Liu et al. 2023) TaxID=3031130 RepID=A0ABT5WSK5_9SPHN|nr:c-type cytochrome [Novosphingobium album (ex Liu et al. 2023)]MDE8653017.1 c-type cytochrome [Novosphingobium album (ex Liu et al. 2023)]